MNVKYSFVDDQRGVSWVGFVIKQKAMSAMTLDHMRSCPKYFFLILYLSAQDGDLLVGARTGCAVKK